MDIDKTGEPGFLDKLIGDYAPKGETFEVVLEKGERLVFRATRDYEDLQSLRVSCRVFVEGISNAVPPSWRDFATKDPALLSRVHYLSELSVSPKLTALDCLKLAKKAPHLFDAIYDGVNQHLAVGAVAKDVGEIVESKNESSETPISG